MTHQRGDWETKWLVFKNLKSKTTWSKAGRPEKLIKAQEDHLEEGKTARPTKGMKNGEPRKIAKKSKEKLKTKAKRERKSQTQKLPLKSTLPDTLNAIPPP
jgi:hypothetical protein